MNLLTVKQVAAKLSCTTSNIYRLQRIDPTFPKSLDIGFGTGDRSRGVRWVAESIDAWVKSKINSKEVLTNEDGRAGQEVHPGAGEEVAA